ncbi:MAG: HAD family hydrolase [Tannerellaceae bacterium]|jgi:putative hydrolase of the HAD superfamily|nr:HAD family hydrolase [Tannerellaceae bacterium]
MFDLDKVKAIILDYGGTIDSNGVHWAEVIRSAYRALGIVVERDAFREAYRYGERLLATSRMALPSHNFRDTLVLKMQAELGWLSDNKLLPPGCDPAGYASDIADWCYGYAGVSVDAARPVLKALYERYPLFLVTNFYGNIHAVLDDFRIREFFGGVVESAVVGIRKPDPAIFSLAVELSGFEAKEIAVIGDSFDKDIAPSATLGCQTVWLRKTGWEDPEEGQSASLVINDFADLKDAFMLR